MLKEKWRGLSGNVKRVILGIGALFFLILIIGAGIYLDLPRRIRLWHPTEQVIREDVTQYLKERYGEEFVITNVLPPGYNYASYIITAYPSGASQDYEHKVTIQGWEKRGLITYYDNYPLVKLIPEYKDYILDIVYDYFPQNKLFIRVITPEWLGENVDIDMTIDKMLSSDWSGLYYWTICLPRCGREDEYFVNLSNDLVETMSTKEIRGPGVVAIIREEERYEKMSLGRKGLDLGEYGIDFVNMSYYISDDGKFEESKGVY